jgi:hypothetical protein
MWFRILVLEVLLLAACIYSQDRNWKHGSVLAIESSGRLGGRGTHSLITYRIDGGEETYDAQEIARKRIQGVEVNGPVEYDVSGRHLYIRDSRLKIHKLKLTRSQPATARFQLPSDAGPRIPQNRY